MDHTPNPPAPWLTGHSGAMPRTYPRESAASLTVTARLRTAALSLGLLLAIASCSSTASDTAVTTAGAGSPTAAGSGGAVAVQAGSSRSAAAAKPVVVTFAGDIAAGTKGTKEYATARATGHVVRRIAPRWALVGGDNA